MPIEGGPIQFNKDRFKVEFETALKKYVNAVDTRNNQYYNNVDEDGEETYSSEEKLRIELDEKHGIEQMTTLCARGLKSATDKEEILEIIFQSFNDLNVKLSSPYESHEFTDSYSRLKFAKRLILELLKQN